MPKKTRKKYTRNSAREKAYNKKKSAYRAKLNRIARARGLYGKRRKRGLDLSHTKSGKVVLEKASKNRARNGMKKGRSKKIRTNTKK